MNDEQILQAYKREVGRDPENRFADDPDWRYKGTKQERERLREEIEEPVILDGQDALFDDC